jgi:DNA-nicking Smr family endonuclease
VSRVRNLRKRGRAQSTPLLRADPEDLAAERQRRRAERVLRDAQLTDEDAEAWGAYTGTPRTRAQDDVHRPAVPPPKADPGPSRIARATLDILVRSGVGAEARANGAAVPETQRAGGLDRQRTRRIAKGGIAIDGRLDLHGLTREGAYSALLAFLGRAQAQGAKTVLVITGKGLEDVDLRARPMSADLDLAPRGVLKRAVPDWLVSGPFARLVEGFGQAHARHGGAGALYVTLRRLR